MDTLLPLYMAVMSKKSAEPIPSMVAHLHTVHRLQQKASSQLAWLEYDIQFRMELAASADRAWTCGDPWQYISCLPGPSSLGDPFDVSEVDTQPPQRTGMGKLKRLAELEGDRGNKPPAKKPKKAGVCRLFNTAPNGCPYGKECIFIHRCNNCGAVNEHRRSVRELLKINSSGNRTPGSRFNSDVLDTSVCIHQLVLKRLSKR